MKLRNTVIAFGIGAATATGLSLLKVNKDLVVGSTAVVIGAGLMVSLRDKNDLNIVDLIKLGTDVTFNLYGNFEFYY